MSLENIIKSYQETIEYEEITIKRLSKEIFQIGSLRLITVLAGIIGIYFSWGNIPVVLAVVFISIVVFLILMVKHNRLFWKRQYSEIRKQDAENELKALDYDFSAFDGAAEKIDAEHSFSLDLDLFGERSFFQSVNRTVTSFGKNFLINIFLYHSTDKTEIEMRQEAIKELTNKQELIASFRTTGQMSGKERLDLKDFSSLFTESNYFLKNTFWKVMAYLMPASYIIWFVLYLLDIVHGGTFVSLYIITLIISSVPSKKVLAILNIFDKKASALDKYSRLFGILENEKFFSELLIYNQMQVKGDITASQAILQLKSYHNNLLQGVTFPLLLLLNPFLMWSVFYSIKIEKWMSKYKEDIELWFASIACFDALASLSIFAYNHPDYTYPEIAESFVFEAEGLGHPLINRNTCVRNDVHIPSRPYFLVVTGANMAGKSTYLRTIGINHMLACIGAPVCAHSMKIYPNQLVTNLRTSDSLADHESYFFAELKRLKMIIDRLQSGEELFIILDEILKGTNSEDKQKGSLALMRQLISLNGNGVIATHDLLLGILEKEYPEYIKNYRFEADIKDDKLTFSYKIREGVAQNMNACFLMKQMGITGL